MRAGKRVAQLLGTPTDDGFVYRVDLRLRPFGDSGPVAVSFDAMEEYLQQHGRDWERYAYVKARPVLRGRVGLRRPLPRRAAPVRLSPLPRLQRVRVAARDEGTDRARGRAPRTAAEREARPRRHPRDRVHRAGVPAAARRQHAAAADAQPARGAAATGRTEAAAGRQPWPSCSTAYRFLRRVENRLQEWNDEQTHELPVDDARPRAACARHGAARLARTRRASCEHHRGRVSAHFQRAVFAPGATTADDEATRGARAHPRSRARRCAPA